MASRIPVPTAAPRGLLGSAPAAAPATGLLGGYFDQFGSQFDQLRQKNPEALLALASGLLNGDVGQGVSGMAQATGQFSQDQRRADLQREGWARDDAQFDRSFGLQEQEFGLKKDALASEAQQRRLVQSTTAKYLETQGAPPELVQLAQAGQGAEALKVWQKNKGGAENYSLSPVYGRDADGNIVVGQLGDNGSIVQSQTPEGFQPLGPYDTNQQKAFGTATGKSMGENTASLPNAETSAAYAMQKIDDVLNDPNLSGATGWQGVLPSWPGTEKKNLDVKIAQLKGNVFLQAFESLKGAGQITEVEGAKAQEAIARLDQAQSDDEFNAALIDLRSVVQTGLQRARAKAGGVGAQMPGTAGNRTSGGVKWSVE